MLEKLGDLTLPPTSSLKKGRISTPIIPYQHIIPHCGGLEEIKWRKDYKKPCSKNVYVIICY